MTVTIENEDQLSQLKPEEVSSLKKLLRSSVLRNIEELDQVPTFLTYNLRTRMTVSFRLQAHFSTQAVYRFIGSKNA